MIPGFEIAGMLGRGGMGVVFKAIQVYLNRPVAIKMVLSGRYTDPVSQARFQLEAEAIARLDHPRIVQVYEFGRCEDQPFFVLEYVAGGSLADRLKAGPMTARMAANLVAELADGMASAHQKGVVHRDLKPANVLLTEAGEPKITDFGLAKIGESDMTASGAVMGTPRYMAPEQAAGRTHEVGTPADVYSLGAILYECLTGRPPFEADTAIETIQRVLSCEPARLHSINPRVPRDLETIALKCLEKDASQRYGTAAELAADLRRFLNGEPIAARPVHSFERALRWCRRKPVLAGSIGFSILAAVALIIGGVWFSLAVADEKRQREVAEERAIREMAERETLSVKQTSAEELRLASEYFARVTQARERIASREIGWTWRAEEDIRTASRIRTPARNPTELRTALAACLAGTDLRESRTLAPGFHTRSLAFHPNGRCLALAEGRVGIALAPLHVLFADIASGEIVRKLPFPSGLAGALGDPRPDMANSIAVSPDGRWLVVAARSGSVHRWDLVESEPKPQTFQPEQPGFGKSAECLDAVFSPDSGALYVATRLKDDGSITRWETKTWKQTARHRTFPGWGSLAVHPRGEHVLCTGADFHSRLLDPQSLETVAELGHMDVPAASPDGRAVATVRRGRLAVWDIRTRTLAYTITEPLRDTAFPDGISGLRFSPDGRLILAWSEHDRHVHLYNAATSERVSEWRSPEGTACSAFDPTGRFIAVAGMNGTTLLELHGQLEHRMVAVHPYRVAAACITAEGSRLAALADTKPDGEILREPSIWNLDKPSALPLWRGDPLGLSVGHSSIASGPQGLTVVFGSNNELRVFGTAPPYARTGGAPFEDLRRMSFDSAGNLWVASGSQVFAGSPPHRQESFASWSNPTAKLTGLGGLLSLDAGSNWAAVGGLDGSLRLFSVPEGKIVKPPFLQLEAEIQSRVGIRTVSLSPDRSFALVGSSSGNAWIMSLPSGGVVATWAAHRDALESTAVLGPRLLATGGTDRAIRFWSWDGKQARELWTITTISPVTGLHAGEGGRMLAATCEGERGVHLWNLTALQQRFEELEMHLP